MEVKTKNFEMLFNRRGFKETDLIDLAEKLIGKSIEDKETKDLYNFLIEWCMHI